MKTLYDYLTTKAAAVNLSDYCMPFYMTFSKACHVQRFHDKHNHTDIAQFFHGLPEHSLGYLLIMDLKTMNSCKQLEYIRNLRCRVEFTQIFTMKDLPAVDKPFFAEKTEE